MSAEKYLQMIQQDIHSVVFAIIDKHPLLVTCVIAIMLAAKNEPVFESALPQYAPYRQ